MSVRVMLRLRARRMRFDKVLRENSGTVDFGRILADREGARHSRIGGCFFARDAWGRVAIQVYSTLTQSLNLSDPLGPKKRSIYLRLTPQQTRSRPICEREPVKLDLGFHTMRNACGPPTTFTARSVRRNRTVYLADVRYRHVALLTGKSGEERSP